MNTLIRAARPWGVAALLAVVTLAAGCGGGGGVQKAKEIRGVVTYKGEKLSSGTVRFLSANNEVAFGRVLPDGTYIITDVVPGEVKIGVQQGGEPKNVGDSSGKPVPKQTKPPVVLPAKYHDPATSGVVKTVDTSTRELNIEFQ